MYSYYFLRSVNIKPPQLLKMSVTTLQLVQFISYLIQLVLILLNREECQMGTVRSNVTSAVLPVLSCWCHFLRAVIALNWGVPSSQPLIYACEQAFFSSLYLWLFGSFFVVEYCSEPASSKKKRVKAE